MSASSTPTDSPRGRQRDGEVDRHRRLADAALAGGHRVDAGARAGLGERDLVRRGVAAQLLAQLAALRVVHHARAAPSPRSRRRPRATAAVTSRVSWSFIGQPATVSSTRDGHAAGASIVDRLDHAELGDRLADLGIVDGGQRGADRADSAVGARPRWYVGSAGHGSAAARASATSPAPLRPSRLADRRVALVPARARATWSANSSASSRRAGLPLGWYDVLLQLAEAPERRLRMAELADRVLLSRSGLTRLVDRLQAEGWSRREPSPGRRPRHVHGADRRPGSTGCARPRPSTWPASSDYWLSHFTDDELRELGALLARRRARQPKRVSRRRERRARRRPRLARRRGRASARTGSRSAPRRSRPGCRVLQTCLLSLLAFTGGTQFAVVGVIAGGGSVARRWQRAAARLAQHAVRDAAGAAAAGARRAPAAGRAGHDRRVDGDGGGAARPGAGAARVLVDVRRRLLFWNLATLLGALGRARSVDPAGSGWTRWCRPRSSRCSRRGCATARSSGGSPLGGAVIAFVLIPFTPPGVPGARRRAPRCCWPAACAEARPMSLWVAGASATIAGCYLLKLAGYLVPARVLDHPRVRRLVELLPVALLAALVVVEAVADGRHLAVRRARGWPASPSARSRCGGGRRSWSW